MIHTSIGLKYEPALEPLHIYVKEFISVHLCEGFIPVHLCGKVHLLFSGADTLGRKHVVHRHHLERQQPRFERQQGPRPRSADREGFEPWFTQGPS